MNKLKILNIGGVSVQKNMYVYELEDEAIIVDCGIGFPETEDFGVDIIIPDFSYVLSIKDKIKGLLLTHGHDDHYSATPYLLQEMPITIFAHPMVQDFLSNKLRDFSDYNEPKFVNVEANKPFQIGKNFYLHPYRVNHSVPNTLGFYINTPAGTVVHQSDFKFDWTPVMDKAADVHSIASLSDKFKPVLMLSDSLGSTHKGFTKSERYIEDSFDTVVKDAPGQVFITTISSNISRIQQAINSASKHNRKVVISGFSIENNVEVAIKHGLIKDPNHTIISEKAARKTKDHQLLYVVPGNYGQVGSTLDKISKGEHKAIKMTENAVVIFSGDPIPGMENAVDKVIDNLISRGAHVVYSELQEDLHVSGHGSRGDLTLMAHLVNPKFYAPVGGGIKHMRAYKDMLSDQGIDPNHVLELYEGETIEIENDIARKGENIELKDVYIDNEQRRGSIENIVLSDRRLLAQNGVLFVVVPYNQGRPVPESVELYTRGFIYVKENQSLLSGMKNNVSETLKSLSNNKDSAEDFGTIKKAVEKSLLKHLYKRIGESPIIVVEKLDL